LKAVIAVGLFCSGFKTHFNFPNENLVRVGGSFQSGITIGVDIISVVATN
jgi:hypothetical protein